LSFVRVTLPALVAIRLAAFAGFGLYRGVWTYASIRDLVAVIGGSPGDAAHRRALPGGGRHDEDRAGARGAAQRAGPSP